MKSNLSLRNQFQDQNIRYHFIVYRQAQVFIVHIYNQFGLIQVKMNKTAKFLETDFEGLFEFYYRF